MVDREDDLDAFAAFFAVDERRRTGLDGADEVFELLVVPAIGNCFRVAGPASAADLAGEFPADCRVFARGRLELPEKTKIKTRDNKYWAHPVIANGKLYVRHQDLLFCFDLKDSLAAH